MNTRNNKKNFCLYNGNAFEQFVKDSSSEKSRHEDCLLLRCDLHVCVSLDAIIGTD